MSIELKPCPFCGGSDFEIVENGRIWSGMKYSEPVSVGVRHWCPATPGQPSRMIERVGRDEASAVTAWNTRHTLSQQPATQHPRGCGFCDHELYAATKCPVCGRETQPATGEPVYQIRKVFTQDAEWAWRDATEAAFHMHPKKHRRILYTHPAPSVPGDDFDLICNAIDKADTITMEGDYMLDSDDCIAVVRVMQVLLSVRAAMLAAAQAQKGGA